MLYKRQKHQPVFVKNSGNIFLLYSIPMLLIFFVHKEEKVIAFKKSYLKQKQNLFWHIIIQYPYTGIFLLNLIILLKQSQV